MIKQQDPEMTVDAIRLRVLERLYDQAQIELPDVIRVDMLSNDELVVRVMAGLKDGDSDGS